MASGRTQAAKYAVVKLYLEQNSRDKIRRLNGFNVSGSKLHRNSLNYRKKPKFIREGEPRLIHCCKGELRLIHCCLCDIDNILEFGKAF